MCIRDRVSYNNVKFGLVDRNGGEVSSFRYKRIGRFNDGLAPFNTCLLYTSEKDLAENGEAIVLLFSVPASSVCPICSATLRRASTPATRCV